MARRRRGSDSRTCSGSGPFTWVDYVDPDHPSVQAFQTWLESLAPFARAHELGEIDELFEAAAAGLLYDTGDATSPIKPIREDPEIFELRRTALSKRLRFYHGEPAELPTSLVALHRHIKQEEPGQQLEVEHAADRYDAGRRSLAQRDFLTTSRLLDARLDRMSPTMIHDATADLTSQVRARAKVLARQDRALMSSLLRLRHGAGLTQKAVAERMGISQQAVNKLERYDSDPKLSTLRRYANAVGAIVEHRVSPDLGQSVAMANEPAWGTWGGPAKVVAIPPTKRPATPGDHWSAPRAVVLTRDAS